MPPDSVRGSGLPSSAILIRSVFISLCTRAAIGGGVSPEMAYTRGDAYIQDIMNCRTIADAAHIGHTMYDDFVRMVHDLKADSSLSPQIRSCCEYIELHAEEPVTLSDVITLEVTQDGKNISMWASGASGSWKEIGKDETIEGYFYGKPLSETPIEIRIYRLIDDMYDDGDLLSSDRIEVIHVEEEPAEETGDIGDGAEP